METTTIDTIPVKIKISHRNFNPETLSLSKRRLRFKHATIEDMEVLKEIINHYPTRSCDFTLGGILIWADYFDYSFCIFSDTLFLKGQDSRGIFFHQPIGKLDSKTAYALIKEYCDEEGIASRIITPKECASEEIETVEGNDPSYLPDWREYMYDINQFIGFSGKKMEKKRNHLNYFMNHFNDYEVEILDGSQTEQLVEFNDKFNLYHKEGDTFDYESSSIGKALEEYNRYPFFGLLLRYHDTIIGYTFGEAVGDTFVIHAEKGDIEYRGVYQALSSLLSRKVADKYPEIKYLNREDDMGNEYLRKSKMSYHPKKFIAKWEISA